MIANAARIALLAFTIAFVLTPHSFTAVLAPFAPARGPVIYDRASILDLTLSHLGLVIAAIIPSAAIAIGMAVLVTRRAGVEFMPLSRSLVNFGQTFPPVAVLALAVPLFGFGAWPTLLALFLYGLLPIFENTLAGLRGVPAAVETAARGVGMSGWQKLTRVELQLALPLILEGVRISTVIAISTATIGSAVAARSLGEIIIAGLNSNNLAFVVQGGLLTGCIAVLVYDAIGFLKRALPQRLAAAPA